MLLLTRSGGGGGEKGTGVGRHDLLQGRLQLTEGGVKKGDYELAGRGVLTATDDGELKPQKKNITSDVIFISVSQSSLLMPF